MRAPGPWLTRIAVFAGSLLALVLCWWPIAPSIFYHFDTVNFALAIEQWVPGFHRPQPPGYPLFVAVSKLVDPLAERSEDALLVTGILGAALAAVLWWEFARRALSMSAAWCALILFLSHPVLWFSGITNPVRIYLAAAGGAVMLALWSAWNSENPRRDFLLAAALLGIGAGFRPETLIFFGPLLLLTGLRTRRKPWEFLLAGALLLAWVLVWLLPTVEMSGGWRQFRRLLNDYSAEQFRSTSLFYGATAAEAWFWMKRAVVWTGIGLLAWIWFLPLALRRPFPGPWRSLGLFLAAAFLPGFLFQLLIHVGDPDHTLNNTPILCLAGGWVLASAFRRRLLTAAAALAAGAAGMWIFFHPWTEIVHATSYYPIEAAEDRQTKTMDAVAFLHRQGPVCLLDSDDSLMSWRIISYYYRRTPVLVIRSPKLDPARRPTVVSATIPTYLPRGKKRIAIPASGNLVWLPSSSKLVAAEVTRVKETYNVGPLVCRRLRPGMEIPFFEYTLVARGGRYAPAR